MIPPQWQSMFISSPLKLHQGRLITLHSRFVVLGLRIHCSLLQRNLVSPRCLCQEYANLILEFSSNDRFKLFLFPIYGALWKFKLPQPNRKPVINKRLDRKSPVSFAILQLLFANYQYKRFNLIHAAALKFLLKFCGEKWSVAS